MGPLFVLGLVISLGSRAGVYGAKPPEAIQILETIDGPNDTKVLHYKGGSVMKDILTADDVTDLPILVYSVTGKTRGGKSFLLNLMYKYLENEGKPNWSEGLVPNIFDFKDGVDSMTKGLWLGTRVFRKTNKNGAKVGIMLMDSQGLFDGEVTGGESVAMSGVSTILSHVQMFNMNQKITTVDLEQIMLHFVPENQNSNTNNHRSAGTNLMFVVRDFSGGRKYGFGLSNGRKYIELEKLRGSDEYKAIWEAQSNVFRSVDCLLLPHPGLFVMSEEFTQSPSLQDLESDFVSEIDSFLKVLFAPDKLTPGPGGLTGRGMVDTLTSLDGKMADIGLSYYNMYLERSNRIVLQDAVEQFNIKVKTGDIYAVKSYMEETLHKTKFGGPSANHFTSTLTLALEGIVNAKVAKYLVGMYGDQTAGDGIVRRHAAAWPTVQTGLKLLAGPPLEVGRQTEAVLKEIADMYYKKLAQEESMKFSTFCTTSGSTGFYNKIVSLRDTTRMSMFLESCLKPCIDFEKTGVSKALLEDIRHRHLEQLRVNVRTAILRNMFRVKEHFVRSYQMNVRVYEVQREHAAVWPNMEGEINALVFETDMERLENTRDIVTKIADIYYKMLREKVYAMMDWEVQSTADGDLCGRFNEYKDDNNLSGWVLSRFPEYDSFRNRGLSHLWLNEKAVLQNYVKLLIFKVLETRANNCITRDEPSRWVRFRDSIFG